MKKLLTLMMVICYLSSCKKSDQRKFIEEISGSYTISSITLTKSDLVTDSITFNNAGEFFFDNCKIDANKSRGFCEGYYIFNNEPKFNFGYNLTNESGETSLRIQLNNSPTTQQELNLLGIFSFVESVENKLILNSISSVSINNTKVKVRLTLTRN
ncbi:MAG: hypothetical protein H7098_13235 [Oligoflexus sp.]|nr:hypothetical protein [Pseudopedobacter sp.]